VFLVHCWYDVPDASHEPLEKPFRFLDLSPKLRNNVYEKCAEAPVNAKLDLRTAHEHMPSVNITLVCKQVRHESAGFSSAKLYAEVLGRQQIPPRLPTRTLPWLYHCP
jgi:hypothetical protein